MLNNDYYWALNNDYYWVLNRNNGMIAALSKLLGANLLQAVRGIWRLSTCS